VGESFYLLESAPQTRLFQKVGFVLEPLPRRIDRTFHAANGFEVDSFLKTSIAHQSKIQNPKSKMTSYGLAIHTSSPALGLAMVSEEEGIRSQTWDLGRETSNYLHTHLLDFLSPQTWQDLSWIAVANGPGGFTGTRLGVVTARTLAQQLDLPVFVISSLAAIAGMAKRTGSLAISMPAQRGEVFGAVYNWHDGNLTTICADAVFSATDWEAKLVELHPAHHQVVAQSANLSDTVVGAIDLAQIAYSQGQRPHWSTALPFYGQHPVIVKSSPSVSAS
jgi:tRNA threonylcarbamoyl adenosine modification protein YeaZ